MNQKDLYGAKSDDKRASVMKLEYDKPFVSELLLSWSRLIMRKTSRTLSISSKHGVILALTI